MNNSKRFMAEAKEGDSDGMTIPSKRARFEREEASLAVEGSPKNGNDDTSFIPTRAFNGHRFLRLHLQLLKAAYIQEIGSFKDGERVVDGMSENSIERRLEKDGPMDEELCQSIELFLRKRGSVRALEEKVRHYEDLYEGAIDFIQEEEGNNNGSIYGVAASLSMSPWNGGRWRAGNFLNGTAVALRSNSSLLFGGGSQQSPFAPPIFPQSIFSSHHNHRHEQASGVGVGLVAGLLQVKFHAALENLKETTTPFEPLIAEVSQRIEALEKLATGQKDHRLPQGHAGPEVDPSKDSKRKNETDVVGHASPIQEYLLQNSTNEDWEEWQARVGTKLQLWKLLRSDLVNL